jgi:hypothetical protein
MRGNDERRDGLFSYVRPESGIPKDHPLRAIREVADEALSTLSAQFGCRGCRRQDETVRKMPQGRISGFETSRNRLKIPAHIQNERQTFRKYDWDAGFQQPAKASR